MDMPDFSSGPSPRRELQGPRPAPLKVRKDSHKIRKPPMAPPPAAGHPHPPPHAAPRPPVIIYTVSPKIIHANPNEFMALVQRLTGPSATSPSSASAFQSEGGGAVSPAARFAAIERTKTPDGRRTGGEMVDGIEIDPLIQRSGQFPGILSPNPSALPPIPANFFNISSENNNPLNFFHDLSPVLHSSRNFPENSFIFPSPSTNFISPHINTPSPNTLELFHSLFDL
ncbi:protein MKS1-like [Salvia hispanica]|uniref:protein MKS1-like n=1 Tax=Salvia hispanica TaxID=49212 RepID=UPI002009B70E|nr:protein MKS1-like [Salvia hispanica]XP_047959175.1 protein MKS1-like [Salvia hispanica]XP_047959176.1 protein MKS1-like [Salvia hispanica]